MKRLFWLLTFVLIGFSRTYALSDADFDNMEKVRMAAFYVERMSNDELKILESSGLFPHGREISTQIKATNEFIEFRGLWQLSDDILRVYKQSGRENSTGYRATLLIKATCCIFYYHYEEADIILAEFDSNVAKYVGDADNSKAWMLARNYTTHEYLVFRQKWRNSINLNELDCFLSQNIQIDSELHSWLLSILLSAVSNCEIYLTPEKVNVYIKRLDHIYLDCMYRGEESAAKQEPINLLAKIAVDLDNTLLQRIQLHRKIYADTMSCMTRASVMICLGNLCHSANDTVNGNALIRSSGAILDSIAATDTVPSMIVGWSALQSLARMYIDMEGATERNQSNKEKEIYDRAMNMPDDCKYWQRCRAYVIENYTMWRRGQSSSLPFVKVARDYYETVKKDDYQPYLVGTLIEAGILLANSGRTKEGLAVLGENCDTTFLGKAALSPHEQFIVNRARAFAYSNMGMTEKALKYERMAIDVMKGTKIDKYESVDIYSEILDRYIAMDSIDSAKNCVVALKKIRPSLPDEEWTVEADWKIALFEASLHDKPSKKLEAYNKILERAKKLGIPDFAFKAAYAMACINYALNKNKKAREYFELAAEYMAYIQNIDFGFYNDYLCFLYSISDRVTWRALLSTVIGNAELLHQDLTIQFITFLGAQCSLVYASMNMEDSWMLMSTILTKFYTLFNTVGDDAYSLFCLIDAVLDPMSNCALLCNQYSKTDSEQYIQMVIESANCIKTHYWDYTSIPFRYIDVDVLLARMYYALGDEERVEAALDDARDVALRHGAEAYLERASFWLRVFIAHKANDYDTLDQLIDRPEFWVLIDDKSGNIESMSKLMVILESRRIQNGDFEEAMDIAVKRFEMMRYFIDNQFIDLSTSQRESMTDNGTASASDIYKVLSLSNTSSNCKWAYDATLYYKNLLLESGNTLRREVYASGDSTQIADYQNMLAMRKKLFTGKTTFTLEQISEESRKMRMLREYEDSISMRLGRLGRQGARRHLKFEDVVKKLENNEATIEFIYDGSNYGALVARKGMKAPAYVKLISGEALNECLMQKYTKLTTKLKNIYSGSNNGAKLYDGIWRPLEEVLAGADVVYYTTVGQLSELSMAAIEDENQIAVCQRYDIRLLSSTAQLVNRPRPIGKHDKKKCVQAFAVGDVVYDADLQKSELRGRIWQALKMSGKEIAHFDSICQQHAINTVTLSRLDASEEKLREISGNSPDIMLISTHGFYFNNDRANSEKYYINKRLAPEESNGYQWFIQPMDRGGLILADANPVWNGEVTRPEDIDGILTGKEIAELDLSNTKLLILSACETGLGESSISEGVNGLQRGFKMAGVGSIILSLWEVNDIAAQKFMKKFYETLFNSGDRYQAYRTALLSMRREYPRDPQKWAPFIMLD